MEEAVAAAGARLSEADTAADVLAKASDATPAGRRAAAGLTLLFREARYSTHPVGEPERRHARALLAEIEATLEVHR
jgi:hypothetical protein